MRGKWTKLWRLTVFKKNNNWTDDIILKLNLTDRKYYISKQFKYCTLAANYIFDRIRLTWQQIGMFGTETKRPINTYNIRGAARNYVFFFFNYGRFLHLRVKYCNFMHNVAHFHFHFSFTKIVSVQIVRSSFIHLTNHKTKMPWI